MKIRAKLLIGFSAMLAIMLTLTMVGFDRLNYMNKQFDSIYQDRYQKIRSSAGMRGEVNSMARTLTSIMLNSDTQSVNEQRDEIEGNKVNATEFYKQMNKSISTSEEFQMIKRIETGGTAYLEYQERILQLLDQNEPDKARDYHNENGQAIVSELLASLNGLSDFENFKMNEEIANAKSAYHSSIQMVTLIMILGLLLGLGIILWVIPSITRGLNVVSMMISSFGNGKMRAIRRIKVTSKDEIGDIARVFKEMAEDLEEKQQMEKAYTQAQAISRG